MMTARSSTLASMRSNQRRMIFARSAAVFFAHVGKAACAASIARRVSAPPMCGTLPSTSPLAGLRISVVRPESAALQAPAIKLCSFQSVGSLSLITCPPAFRRGTGACACVPRRKAGGQVIKLSDPTLWKEQSFIAGAWSAADSGLTTEIRNPANGEVLGSVPYMGGAETRRAIEAAHTALPSWAKKTAAERAKIMRRWFDLMLANADDLAVIMTAEQGKPLAESKGEITYAASFIEWFAEEGKRLYGDIIPGHQADKRIMVLRQPVGVVAAITPWNFPAAMITRKAGPALGAGCPIVITPAPQTPYSALAMAELAQRAGIPDGVISVVTGDAVAIGGEFTGNEKVRKLSFTGSTQVGKLLMAQCARSVKKVSLELGGNAPFIVLDDADLDAAVSGAIASKYRNTGPVS